MNSAKLPTNNARAHSAAATAAANADSQNPARRPYRPMNSDIAGAVRSEPTTTIEIGNVARLGSGASTSPAHPATMMLIASCDPKIACTNTSTATLRLARVSVTAATGLAIGVRMTTGHPQGAPG